jgi:signal transduction histidine kinase
MKDRRRHAARPETRILTGNALAASTLLNVNDNDAARYTVGRMLAHAGFDLLEARTGTEAIDVARRRQPRLVVLDIKLPDMSGLDVCRRLKSDPETAHIKVLHTSAVFISTEFKVKSLESGADGYLAHPFEAEELIAIARSLLRLGEAEQDLRDVVDDLREANNRIHQFLAMLSHELRNPLSAIASGLALLDHYEPRDPGERSTRVMLRRQTGNLRRMVDDLLDVARVTQGKIEPHWETIDLRALLRRVVDTARRTRTDERSQQLVVDAGDEPILVRADPVRLEQVFTNVLDNASKYTPDAGRVDVRATRLADGYVRIEVQDTGAGIAVDALPRVFDLFEQADVPLARSKGGLGVGLTLVRTLVEMHGGHVEAHSGGIGKGTRIEVTLPMAIRTEPDDPVPAPGGSASASDASSPGARRRVLIVEDNIDAQQTLKLLLEAWGHEVHVAADGPAGVAAILALAPDVAFVDIGLPQLDGYAVARRVADANMAHPPYMVALTGYGDPQQRDAALGAGFDQHVVKPADPGQLRGILDAAAGQEAKVAGG